MLTAGAGRSKGSAECRQLTDLYAMAARDREHAQKREQSRHSRATRLRNPPYCTTGGGRLDPGTVYRETVTVTAGFNMFLLHQSAAGADAVLLQNFPGKVWHGDVERRMRLDLQIAAKLYGTGPVHHRDDLDGAGAWRAPEGGDNHVHICCDGRAAVSALKRERVIVAATSNIGTQPTAQLSWGELFDKITILEIKEARLTSAQAIANVRRELAVLADTAKKVRNPDLGSGSR